MANGPFLLTPWTCSGCGGHVIIRTNQIGELLDVGCNVAMRFPDEGDPKCPLISADTDALIMTPPFDDGHQRFVRQILADAVEAFSE